MSETDAEYTIISHEGEFTYPMSEALQMFRAVMRGLQAGEVTINGVPVEADGKGGYRVVERSGAAPTPVLLTVDLIVQDQRGRLLLIRRGNEPFKGALALPGGFVEPGEAVERAAIRELREETGIEVEEMEIVNVFSAPGRDPRGPVVSILYRVTAWRGIAKAGDDAADYGWFFPEDFEGETLAFDHEMMVAEGYDAPEQ